MQIRKSRLHELTLIINNFWAIKIEELLQQEKNSNNYLENIQTST